MILPRRLDQALGLVAETLRLRAAQRAAHGFPRVGSADRRSLCRRFRLPAVAAASCWSWPGDSAWVSRNSKGRSRPRTACSRSRFDWSSPRATNGTWRSSPSCNWSDRAGREVSSRFAGPRYGWARLEQAQGRWFGDDAGFENLPDLQHPGRATQQPARREIGTASGACCRCTARARGPARPVDERPGPPSAETFTIDPEQSRGRPFRLLNKPLPIRCEFDCSRRSADPHGMESTRLSRGSLVGAGTDRDGLVASPGRRARLLPRRMGRWHAGLGLSRQRSGRWYLHGFFD